MSAAPDSRPSSEGEPQPARLHSRSHYVHWIPTLVALLANALIPCIPGDAVSTSVVAPAVSAARIVPAELAPASEPAAPAVLAHERQRVESPEPLVPPSPDDWSVVARVPSLWRLATDHEAETGVLPIGDYLPASAGIEIDPSVLQTVEAGDAVALPVPEKGAFEAQIERVSFSSNGDKVLNGHLAAQEDDYPVTITIGATVMLASLITPYGAYVIQSEVEGGAGWIMLDDFFDVLVDPAVADVLYPDDPEQWDEEPDPLSEDELEELDA